MSVYSREVIPSGQDYVPSALPIVAVGVFLISLCFWESRLKLQKKKSNIS